MSVVHLNQENFEKEVVKSDIPVIIDFWASWCGPCQMMGPVFEDLSKEYEGKLKFAKLNTEEQPELASKFAIRGIPSLLILKDNDLVDKFVGFSPKDALKEKIDKTLANLN